MKMFDWDEQELANIIWGEGREADDHIVPYSEDIEKKVLSSNGDNDQKSLIGEDSESKASEKTTSKLFLDGSKRDRTDGLSASAAVVSSQLDLPLMSASKPDDGCIAKNSQLDIDPEASQNHHEDKELGDLVSNSWASIGSFDDLDRIFSNDDLEGKTSLGSTDELWSTKDLTSGAANSSSAALGSTNWEYGALGNTSDISPYSGRTIGRHVEQEDYAMGTTSLVKDKIGFGIKTAIDPAAAENIACPNKSTHTEKWSKSVSRHEQASDRITDSGLLPDVYDTWPFSAADVPQFGRQQQLAQVLRPRPHLYYSTPYGAPYAYGNFTNQYPVNHSPKPTKDELQSLLSGSEASHGVVITLDKPVETNIKPTKMTPQEKIEKLRRRQQMQAMLAIKKQKQRLGPQASSGDHSLSCNKNHEDQARHTEITDLDADEALSILPCYDPGSPNKGEDSSTISNIDDDSVENTALYQLQDIISRLDMKIRLCIRDSLYRLACSAPQRHYASDTSGTKRSYEPDVAKQDNHDSFIGNTNVETETNHIDRAVAQLLFHRPFKLSVRHSETLESSTSTKVSTKQETASPCSLPVGFLGKSSENARKLFPYGSDIPQEFLDSHKEDVPNDLCRKEMRFNPQMKQTSPDADSTL